MFLSLSCACCGESCTIQQDTFTGDDGDPLAAFDADDWELLDDRAHTSTDNALAIGDNDGDDANGVVSATFQGDDYSDEFLLILSYEDASNYLFALFTLAPSSGACGTMKLYKRESGTNTQLGSTRTIDDFEPGDDHLVGFCRNGTRVTAFRFADDIYTSVEADTAPGTITGLKAGFASGTITADITVDDYLYTRHDCRECAAPCEFFRDDFDRANNTNLGCNWTEEAGSAQILSNELSLAANSLVITTVETPTGVQLASAYIDAAATNDQARVIVRYTDTSNYLFGEIVFGGTNSTLNLYQRSGGTDTLRATATLLGITSAHAMSLKVCFYGNTLTAQAYRVSPSSLYGSIAAVISSPPSGKRAGVGTATALSAIAFDRFRLLRHNEAGRTQCDECSAPCNVCDVAYQPYSAYAVDLGAPPLTDSGCGYCDQIGGEYLLERSPCTSNCAWLYCVPSVCDRTTTFCPAPKWNFSVSLGVVGVSAGVVKWRLVVGYGPGGTGCNCATDPSCAGILFGAIYESANVSTDTRCQDVPITLTKLTDTFASSGLCTGSLPGTVTLTRAA